jgi:hypothetical protein
VAPRLNAENHAKFIVASGAPPLLLVGSEELFLSVPACRVGGVWRKVRQSPFRIHAACHTSPDLAHGLFRRKSDPSGHRAPPSVRPSCQRGCKRWLIAAPLVPSGESLARDRVEDGTRRIRGSEFGGESTSEARRTGREPLQSSRVPLGAAASAAAEVRQEFRRAALALTSGGYFGYVVDV